MKRVFLLVCLFCMTATASFAQEKKSYTLEDVIPGGNNYFNLVPKNIPGMQWWGDVCVRTDVENIVTINIRNGKETVLVTLDEVNEALLNGEKPFQPTQELKQLRTLMGASLPWGDQKVITFRQGNYMIWYDFGQKKISNLFRLNEKAANLDFCKENGYVAYTVGSNLCIAHEGEKDLQINPDEKKADPMDIVYGQAVHRNEFGIYKGTFWSPRGNCLAFYRMDQSMVTAYPQVNTTTRIATLEPDKYPMAGMTSHKVTVGVYHIQSGKTVYLQAGDPTDRYFTNISWSPDEKSIYVIELNRDQNHSQLVRYNAETGAKEAMLFEETHPKYVEPQHPIVFLPWDSNQFIYWSQRDGFHHLYLYNKEGQLIKQLTQGDWLVQDILGFNTARKEMIIASTEISPLQTNIFSLNVKTGKRTLLGQQDGTHSARLSASGTYLIDNFTSFNVPREISILPTNGKTGINLLTATDPMKEQYNLPEITLGTIKAADGKTDLYYRLIKPVNFDPNKKYPAIIYVYGGPHAQLIHNNRFYDARGWDLYMAQKLSLIHMSC